MINDYENEYHLYLSKAITPFQGIEPASLMYVPLFINKEIIGLLSVRTLAKNAYSLQKMEILKILAVFIGNAIANTRASKGLRKTYKPLPKSYHFNPLSARELEVLNLLSMGLANRVIASKLLSRPAPLKHIR